VNNDPKAATPQRYSSSPRQKTLRLPSISGSWASPTAIAWQNNLVKTQRNQIDFSVIPGRANFARARNDGNLLADNYAETADPVCMKQSQLLESFGGSNLGVSRNFDEFFSKYDPTALIVPMSKCELMRKPKLIWRLLGMGIFGAVRLNLRAYQSAPRWQKKQAAAQTNTTPDVSLSL